MDTSISGTASNKRLRVGILTSTYARASDDPQVPWMRELNNRVKNTVDHLVVMAPSYKGLKSHEIDGVRVERFRYAPKSIEALTHDKEHPTRHAALALNCWPSPIYSAASLPFLYGL